jgi:hypothetical protein
VANPEIELDGVGRGFQILYVHRHLLKLFRTGTDFLPCCHIIQAALCNGFKFLVALIWINVSAVAFVFKRYGKNGAKI